MRLFIRSVKIIKGAAQKIDVEGVRVNEASVCCVEGIKILVHIGGSELQSEVMCDQQHRPTLNPCLMRAEP